MPTSPLTGTAGVTTGARKGRPVNLELRLRQLEGQLRPEPPESPFVEWVTTLPLDDIRALRDYLTDLDSDTPMSNSTAEQRHGRALALLAVAPEAVRRSLGLVDP